MPLYIWLDSKSGTTVDILRSFEDYRDPPTEEEAAAAGLSPEQVADASWEKRLGTGIQVVKGSSWGPGKGSW